jgi:hypothetical protein
LTVQDALNRINMEGLTGEYADGYGVHLRPNRHPRPGGARKNWTSPADRPIVGESSGEATQAGEDVREFRIPFEEIARRLWSHLLNDLFTGLPAE